MHKLFRFLISAGAIPTFLINCNKPSIPWYPFEKSVANPMLKPGETLGEMTITTGAERAFPLWSFCLPTVKDEHLITVDCDDVSFSKLAIGHTFGVIDLIPQPVKWEELTWQMELDGHPMDLEGFGTHNFVHPDLALHASPVREVFRTVRVWNVVLLNPAPGAHTIHGQARTENELYTWVVNFAISEPPAH